MEANEFQEDGIYVRGSRVHNLKNVSTFFPRNKITVITGLSGSGKSSLAFDTVYAEGQRRYLESLSTYARQFMEQVQRPDVDVVHGLSPSIAIDQKTTSNNPRSTVGTTTGIYDILRLIYSKIGVPHCPNHNIPLSQGSIEKIVDRLNEFSDGAKFQIFSVVARKKKGEFSKEITGWLRKGFSRAMIDGEMKELESVTKLAKTKFHTIELLVDQIVLKKAPAAKSGASKKVATPVDSDSVLPSRIHTSLSLAMELSSGFLKVKEIGSQEELNFSLNAICPECDFHFPEMDARLFSFNDPRGACQDCSGVGEIHQEEWGDPLEGEDEDQLFYSVYPCETCHGKRLNKTALSVFVQAKNIADLTHASLPETMKFLGQLKLSSREEMILERPFKELKQRLGFLADLGLSYLSLDRSVRTLSGGEAQRVRLSSQLGSGLIGVLYVLDEPSIGLHPRDHDRLLKTLGSLRDRGNTILMVEHDELTIKMADKIIDIGPRAGLFGGEILAEGTLIEIYSSKQSVTAPYLRAEKVIADNRKRKIDFAKSVEIVEATGNNLKNISVKFPLNTLTVVTGVSGSGKSTLVIDTLLKGATEEFSGRDVGAASHSEIKNLDLIHGIIHVTQKPIGRTPRSNPATYVGLFSYIRNLFSQLPESKMRGFKPGRFSFNVKEGRCGHCEGMGYLKLEMQFMADVEVLCPQCDGARFNPETLAVKYNGKSISDVLEMSITEASEFFKNHYSLRSRLETLEQVGLGYIKIGQSATTLSGGEAQRIKLSKELAKKKRGHVLYILDEPTTGLHFEDVHKLIELLHELVDRGNTVVVIEHHTDVMKSADYIIDMGPEGGVDGGLIVACGSVEQVRKSKTSITAKYL